MIAVLIFYLIMVSSWSAFYFRNVFPIFHLLFCILMNTSIRNFVVFPDSSGLVGVMFRELLRDCIRLNFVSNKVDSLPASAVANDVFSSLPIVSLVGIWYRLWRLLLGFTISSHRSEYHTPNMSTGCQTPQIPKSKHEDTTMYTHIF